MTMETKSEERAGKINFARRLEHALPLRTAPLIYFNADHSVKAVSVPYFGLNTVVKRKEIEIRKEGTAGIISITYRDNWDAATVPFGYMNVPSTKLERSLKGEKIADYFDELRDEMMKNDSNGQIRAIVKRFFAEVAHRIRLDPDPYEYSFEMKE